MVTCSYRARRGAMRRGERAFVKTAANGPAGPGRRPPSVLPTWTAMASDRARRPPLPLSPRLHPRLMALASSTKSGTGTACSTSSSGTSVSRCHCRISSSPMLMSSKTERRRMSSTSTEIRTSTPRRPPYWPGGAPRSAQRAQISALRSDCSETSRQAAYAASATAWVSACATPTTGPVISPP